MLSTPHTRRPLGRVWALLVLSAVLGGLLAMHGLASPAAPGGMPAGGTRMAGAPMAALAEHHADVPEAPHGPDAPGAPDAAGPSTGDADVTAGHGTPGGRGATGHLVVTAGEGTPGGPDVTGGGHGAGGGHLQHADASCAAAGTSTAYVPPALAASGLAQWAAEAVATGWAGVPTGAGRAPPDLAHLQLLRI